ncbi:MAG: hypothetical protein ACXQT5_06525, partial [Candidatus Syntropharchaeia archaeon]
DFPSVDAVAIVNGRYISYWDAKPYTGEGTYNLLIGFKKIREKNPDKLIIVILDNLRPHLAKKEEYKKLAAPSTEKTWMS